MRSFHFWPQIDSQMRKLTLIQYILFAGLNNTSIDIYLCIHRQIKYGHRELILDMKILALQLQATAGKLDFHKGRLSKVVERWEYAVTTNTRKRGLLITRRF